MKTPSAITNNSATAISLALHFPPPTQPWKLTMMVVIAAVGIGVVVAGGMVAVGWLLKAQQHAHVSQGLICLDNCMCCHTEIEVADQTFLSHPVTVY